MARVLVVDDEANLRKVLSAILTREGHEVLTAPDGQAALELLADEPVGVVVTDLVMPRLGGMELLKSLAVSHPDVPVIMITAHGTVDSAVEAIKAGAFDYITKPFEQTEIQAVVRKAARTNAMNRASVRADGKARSTVVGKSPEIEEIFRIVDKVADTPSTVLITGESGTGKELIAAALHEGSSRRDKPFIRINCAAIPRDLLESELFGYERGAFTGAVTSKPGRFELADTGTLFLDEIGEIPLEMQVKLLRVLQESEFERVGGIKTTRVDVRLVAATNRALAKEIEAGRFRQDLFYRLNVVPIHLPPLRDRRSDIPLLCAHFVEKYNKRLNKALKGVSESALALLQGHPWPGNIRELENVIERATLFADGPLIESRDLPEVVRQGPVLGAAVAIALSTEGMEPGGTPLKDFVRARAAELEREMIVKALEETGGNVTRAARLLQISRKSLQVKMKDFGLRDEDPADDERN